MAHLRERYGSSHIKEALSFSSLVGVLGQRQVGKTTLVELVTGSDYVTFDDVAQKSAAELAPQAYIAQFQTLTTIDECQMVPGLFPALKLRVQRNKRPGQFILTGSVRFTSRVAIQESLTGRIHNIEILPLTVSEMHKKTKPEFIKWPTFSSKQLQLYFAERMTWFSHTKIPDYLQHGGLPGICFLRKQAHRVGKFKSHIETLLQRDIRFVIETTVPYRSLLALLKHLAMYQGLPFVLKDASRATGISEVTIKKLIAAYEALFLIRRFGGCGDRTGDIFYLEDQGMASYLTSEGMISSEQRFAFSQLFSSAHYSHMNEFQLTYFETKGGAQVPFVFDIAGRKIAFILNLQESMSSSSIKTIKSFQERFPGSFVYVLSRSAEVAKVFHCVYRVPLAGIV